LQSDECQHAAVEQWRNEHCCRDSEKHAVLCSDLAERENAITARNSRRHWSFGYTTPEILGYTQVCTYLYIDSSKLAAMLCNMRDMCSYRLQIALATMLVAAAAV
jgi:hypothetical protein